MLVLLCFALNWPLGAMGPYRAMWSVQTDHLVQERIANSSFLRCDCSIPEEIEQCCTWVSTAMSPRIRWRNISKHLNQQRRQKTPTNNIMSTRKTERLESWTARGKAAGAVDILINNVCVQLEAPCHEYSLEDWNKTLAVGLTSSLDKVKMQAREKLTSHGAIYIMPFI